MTGNATNNLAELSPVKRALLELREMRAKLQALEEARTEPIAVIGMGCRFPGDINTPESYWQLLCDGVDAVTEVPADRWNVDEYYDADSQAPGKISTRWGGFLSDVDKFDPQFFGISPREAEGMDPQQRLLLEVTWEALEHAGQAPDKLSGSATGIFVGISSPDYGQFLLNSDQQAIGPYLAQGMVHSVASGRLAYVLGLQGPAISLDTACSSSLVAIHLAIQSLRQGESRMALAGGVNVILLPEISISFSRAGMMAADGRCKTFDARADGFVRSEGCGMVVLKRLSDALADNDNVLAVIRGTALNQDGRSNGLTAPNGPSQEAVIRAALANGNVAPVEVGYVETHGTGTSLGDPIEVQALGAALGQERTPEDRLLLGSVKTNLGHLEAAAGVASLMKAVLVLQHRQIPPHLHLQVRNPYIAWEDFPVDIPLQQMPLPARNGRFIAGVSSFGFSGTNAHVVLEAAPVREITAAEVERPLHLLKLSARREEALQEVAYRFDSALAESRAKFADICFTANAGRADLPHRLALTATSAEDARARLAAFWAGESPDGVFSGQTYDATQPEIAFLFTGHGAQYVYMGRQLYEAQPTFRAALEECDHLLRAYVDVPLLSMLYPQPGQPNLLDKMTYAQPALFAVEYALAQLWRSWGIEPTMVMGHSVGEYVAACIAGVFSLADGLKLVSTRGRLMDSLPEAGAMAAIFAEEDQVAAAVAPYSGQVSIAVINGPTNIVISGTKTAVQAIEADFKVKGIKSRRLAVAQAAHSPLLDPILDDFERAAATVTYASPQIGLISCLTGELVAANEVTNAGYWRRHLRQPVRFATAVETLYREGHQIFLEIGPQPTLLGMGRRCLPQDVGVWLPSLRQNWDDWQQMLESLAELYVQGVNVDWTSFDRDYPRHRLPLPTYPWARERYWLDGARQPAARLSPEPLPWQSIVTAARRQAQQCPLDLAPQTYPAKWASLDRLTTAYVVDTLRKLNAYSQKGESHTVDSLITQLGIVPIFRNLISRWLQRLVKAGWLQQQGERFTSRQPLPDPGLDGVWREANEILADIPAMIDYVRRCGQKLTTILTGAESPLETIFPGGSFTTADFLYHEWALVRYFNGISQAIVETVLPTMLPDKKLRILEVGAGSGGTTAALLPLLPPDRTTYTYTDLSDLFLARAEEKFKDYPFIQYGIFDAEGDPREQGYPLHSFDLIVAANVLHATRNLDETLDHVRTLLAPDGLLLLFEVTEHLAWFDITTGLIEGWGRFEDTWRQENPLLSPLRWQEALHARGFAQAAAFPEPGMVSEIFGQHVLVAQVPSELPQGHVVEAAGDTRLTIATPASKEASANGTAVDQAREEFAHQLAEALPDDRHDLLVEYVRGHVRKILRLASIHKVDRRHRLMDLGVDSLMAVELRNRLANGLVLDKPIPATLIFDYPTVEAIAGYVAQELLAAGVDTTAGSLASDEIRDDEVVPAASEKIGELSDEEVEALLLKKLNEL